MKYPKINSKNLQMQHMDQSIKKKDVVTLSVDFLLRSKIYLVSGVFDAFYVYAFVDTCATFFTFSTDFFLQNLKFLTLIFTIKFL
jgi:hypothetical protein